MPKLRIKTWHHSGDYLCAGRERLWESKKDIKLSQEVSISSPGVCSLSTRLLRQRNPWHSQVAMFPDKHYFLLLYSNPRWNLIKCDVEELSARQKLFSYFLFFCVRTKTAAVTPHPNAQQWATQKHFINTLLQLVSTWGKLQLVSLHWKMYR